MGARPLRDRSRWLIYRIGFSNWITQGVPRIVDTLRDYAVLMRLHRPIGIWLLLWPTLWALWIASNGRPDPHILLIFAAGVVLMRSAGCVINDVADRDIDPQVRRTQDRPIAAGRVSPVEAWVLFAILSLGALMLVLRLNPAALLLGLLGGLLAVTYPLFKRFFALPQLYLGLSFGWGIPMAFAAQTENVPRVAWLLFLANVLWVTVYDTLYAMVDREDDLKIGVRSSAIVFGEADRHVIACLQAMVLLTLYLVGQEAHLGVWYRAGEAAAAIFFLYQLLLIRRREPSACFAAFGNNQYVGMAVFIGIALDYLYR